MNLYLLRPIPEDNLWEDAYDMSFGFVVRAQTEDEARKMAAEKCGDEGRAAWIGRNHST